LQVVTHCHPASHAGQHLDSSATASEGAAGRDGCRAPYLACPVCQTLIPLQGTGTSPSSPSYRGSEDAEPKFEKEGRR